LNTNEKIKALFREWGWRYIKYNAIGLSVFLLNIVLYVIIFSSMGEWPYIVVSVNGGILEFALISYFNKTKKGIIFESYTCTPNEINSAFVTKDN
jgi:hypothetical protein